LIKNWLILFLFIIESKIHFFIFNYLQIYTHLIWLWSYFAQYLLL
jgi:hypothetical protein